MEDHLFHLGQFLTLLMIAVALGMDAFSLGIGVGIGGMRLRDVLKVSIAIGLFHICMPLIGIFVGLFLSGLIGHIADYLSGAILILLGIHMLWNAVLRSPAEKSTIRTSGLGLLLFSFTVSLDALSVGLSFGLIEVNTILAVGLFGLIGGFMAGCGLMLGRSIGNWLGAHSEMLGGLILLAVGCKFII
ncbi:manganese efflux pump MntP family protein [Brevibacillus massiliensis]|jgi:putative Mn2+ efflux pump MntP|uniref:manganese efflux pump MntP n=1 Tax=Brevibacillus massiliensis TaxID=1118054 RepID=UPI0002DF2411|nr:manganese efflux pump MntP family protein [Brevibacillus massiliensis]